MNLEDTLGARIIGNDDHVTLLAHAYPMADAVDVLARGVRVKGQVVEASVRQPVAIVLGFLDAGDEAELCEG